MKIFKFIIGFMVIIMMFPVVGIIAIIGGGISGLYYLVFMMLYRLLDFANGSSRREAFAFSRGNNYKR